MLDDQPQAATTQLMRSEGAGLLAAAAQLSVTRTLDAGATHGPVMFFDFAYSCRVWQFDMDGKIFRGRRSEGQPRASLLLFHAHAPA